MTDQPDNADRYSSLRSYEKVRALTASDLDFVVPTPEIEQVAMADLMPAENEVTSESTVQFVRSHSVLPLTRAAEETASETSIKGEYEFVAVIGEGYFSIVKRYRHRRTGQEVAIKELKRAFINNAEYTYWFRREIDILNALKGHPNIINLINHYTSENQLYYVTERAKINLYNYIKRNNQHLALPDRIRIFDQILEAIQHAHVNGIIHRDINPNNVLVFEEGAILTAKVSDFGLGKNLTSESHFTKSEIARYGQAYYVAPEQREKLKSATVESDIYSLGKLLYFILTGRDPDNIQPTIFHSLILKAIEHDTALRHKDIAEFIQNYRQIKDIAFTEDELDQALLVRILLEQKEGVDWLSFHKSAIKGEYVVHVYSDYISPVLDFLPSQREVESYYQFIGAEIENFVNTFSERVNDCYKVNKWPFRAMNSFGDLFKNLYAVVKTRSVKMRCLKELWILAHVLDQWYVQSIVRNILEDKTLSDDLLTELAMFIMDSRVTESAKKLVDSKISPIIKRAIQSKFQEEGQGEK
ncbi:MAG: serine/threonine protein kinase [Chlorobiales bacterium]|nr:serine/threonine protein kinase [Chlorobiales bacterium]